MTMVTLVRTAAVVGTPDWQLDRMYETDTAQKLEESMNSEFRDFQNSVVCGDISAADYEIGQALVKLCSAGNQTENTPFQAEMDALIERLEDLRCDMNLLKKKIAEVRFY